MINKYIKLNKIFLEFAYTNSQSLSHCFHIKSTLISRTYEDQQISCL